MKKRLLISILCLLIIGIFVLTACGDGGDNDIPDIHNHEYIQKNGQPPSCTVDGIRDHFACNCGELFDLNQVPVKAEDLIIPKKHSLSHRDGYDGSCYNTGAREHWFCILCQKNFADNEGLTELSEQELSTGYKHPVTKVEAVAAGCYSDGNKEHYRCESCFAFFLDKECTKKAAYEDIRTEPTGHSYSDKWSYDEFEHWHESTCEHTSEREDVDSHSFGEWETVTAATCEKDGLQARFCLCGAREELPIDKHHSFSSEWSFDENGHWQAAICAHSAEKNGESEHSFSSGNKCDVCPYERAAVLEYSLSSDKTYYTVIGIGTVVSANIVIPEVYEGLPVKAIGYRAFYKNSDITSLTIPDSITVIGESAFYKCTAITKISIGKGVTTLGDGAFENCDSLTELFFGAASANDFTSSPFSGGIDVSVTFGASVTKIPAYLFGTGGTVPLNIKSIVFESGSKCESIGRAAFAFSRGITEFIIPDTVLTIGDHAFSDCSNLKSLHIPANVTSIGKFVFSGCDSIESFTVDDKNKVYRSSGNCLIETQSKTLLAGFNTSVIPDNGSVSIIGESAFAYCTEIVRITIPDSVTRIASAAFMNCTKLTAIVIGSGVNSIVSDSFSGCANLEKTFFNGTSDKWPLPDTMPCYFYSETEPPRNTDGTAYEGRYWHYVDEVPTVWEIKA